MLFMTMPKCGAFVYDSLHCMTENEASVWGPAKRGFLLAGLPMCRVCLALWEGPTAILRDQRFQRLRVDARPVWLLVVGLGGRCQDREWGLLPQHLRVPDIHYCRWQNWIDFLRLPKIAGT